jgi:hypothetical protein
MTPEIVVRKKSFISIFRWMRYNGMKHQYVPVNIDREKYVFIGENIKYEFYMLKK